MNKEIWKPVVGYENLYEVSNFGRVKSLPRNSTVKYARILKSHTNRYGYLHVNLYKNNKRKDFLVHRLVAEAFIPNPDNLPVVNHKDENPSNNFSTNLEWCTYEYNINYGTSQQRKSHKLSKPVCQYTLDNELIKIWSSLTECKNKEGFNIGHIYECCRGIRKTHKGFKWSYFN